MIISKTPVRISLFGGSTDYPDYLKYHNGLVVGSTINQYIYLALRKLPPFFEWKSHLSYSQVEKVDHNSEIKHNAIREAIEYMGFENVGVELTHMCDMPSRSGIGSSSSFIVGLLNILYRLANNTDPSKSWLYETGVHLEQDILKECVGLQDTAWAAYGGFKYITFHKGTRDVGVKSIPGSNKDLEKNLLLFFTGTKRGNTGHEIAKTYANNLHKRKEMGQIYDIAYEGLNAIMHNNLDDVGLLLHKSWMAKKSTGNISTSEIDQLYEYGLQCGALGGKLIGAGGGGNLLFYVPQDKQEKFRKSFKGILEIPFEFEDEGSKIIYIGD